LVAVFEEIMCGQQKLWFTGMARTESVIGRCQYPGLKCKSANSATCKMRK